MNCPYCNSKDYIPKIAQENARNYSSNPLVATLCCKQPVRIHAVTTFKSCKVIVEYKEDDWGVPFEKFNPKIDFQIGQEIILKSSDGSTKKEVLCSLDYEFKDDVHYYGLGLQNFWTWYSMKEDGRLTDNMFGVYEIIL